MTKSKEISQLKGLGPKSAVWLARAGIITTEQLLAADPFELYMQLRLLEPAVSLNFLYAIIGAQKDLPWQVVARSHKQEIFERLRGFEL